jgi:hypothetical protein
VSLLEQRAATTETEHVAAIAAAERRLGRKLTVAEKRIDIVGIDRDLTTGKSALHNAVAAEQRRAAEQFARDGTPIQLKVTPAMRTAINDLYDAGAGHAKAELEAAGITPA